MVMVQQADRRREEDMFARIQFLSYEIKETAAEENVTLVCYLKTN
jgi:hypothetical protein